jgi:hypothetical protein
MRSVRSLLVAVSLAAIVLTGCSTNRGSSGGGPAEVPSTDTTTAQGSGQDTGQDTAQGTGSVAPASPVATSTGSIRTKAEVKAAVGTATEFMRREVGIGSPVASNFRWTGRRTAKIDIRARFKDSQAPATGPITVVSLERLTKVWYVTGTSTRGIQVTSPGRLVKISSPIRVRGQAHAFEGNVRVRVTQDRYGKDRLLGTGNVLGRGDALGPFSGRISFNRPTGTTGSIIFDEPSAIDGSSIAATVVRVRLAKSGNPLADRVSDPKKAADLLVDAWVRADKAAAAKVATKDVVTRLFSDDRSGEDPAPGTCKLAAPGEFHCTYPMGTAKFNLVVEGGASAGYLVTGFSITG